MTSSFVPVDTKTLFSFTDDFYTIELEQAPDAVFLSIEGDEYCYAIEMPIEQLDKLQDAIARLRE